MSELPDPFALVEALKPVIADLSWASETDAPFQAMVWPGAISTLLTPAQILETAHLPLESPVAAIDLETFLAPALLSQAWHSATDQDRINRFQSLKTLLQQNLTNLQVYRCGSLECDIFILGQAPDGAWVVLRTAAVET